MEVGHGMLGRVLQRNQRPAARLRIVLQAAACPPGLRLHVEHDPAFDDWAAVSEGTHVLRTSIIDWSDEQRWGACIQLTQAEATFRTQKDGWLVRPIRHRRAGLGSSSRAAPEELAYLIEN